MTAFYYVAETADGKRESGSLEANNEADAKRQLVERGMTVISIVPSSEIDESIVLEEDQLAALTQAVASAAKSRVPLEVTLAAVAEEKEDRHLAQVARQLSNELARGATIDEAVARLGDRLPPEIGSVFRAGVECGDLSGTVERFAQQRFVAQQSRLRIRSAIAYPLMIFAILVPLSLFFSWYVIPMFGELYDEFGLDLPQVTEFLLVTSNNLPWVILAALGLVLLVPLVLRLVGGRWLLHRVRGATPLVGKLWIWSGQREFASTLDSFLSLKLPLANALTHTADVIGDRNVSRACRGICERTVQGESLGRSLAASIHFDRSLAALVAWGEEHGLLGESLRLAATVYDDRIEQHTAVVRRLLPPVTMVVVAALALLVVISLMLPLVKLIEGLSG